MKQVKILLLTFGCIFSTVSMGYSQTIINYNIELPPNAKFSGYRHLLSGEGLQFAIQGNVSWLSLENAFVASASCENPHSLQFNFSAPQQAGIYTARVSMQYDLIVYNITLKVTPKPQGDTLKFVLDNRTPSSYFLQTFAHFNSNDHSCIQPYFARLNRTIQFVPYPATDWLKADKWSDTLLVQESITSFLFTIQNNGRLPPGKYESILMLQSQWGTFPAYTYLLLEVKGGITGVEEAPVASLSPRIFPNPARDQVFVELLHPLDVDAVMLTNVLGQVKKIEMNALDKERFSIDTSGFSSGTYSLTFLQSGKIIATKQLIIQN